MGTHFGCWNASTDVSFVELWMEVRSVLGEYHMLEEVSEPHLTCQILEGSFSAASKPIFASRYWFCNIFYLVEFATKF